MVCSKTTNEEQGFFSPTSVGHISWAKIHRSQDTISFLPTPVLPHTPHFFETCETLERVRYTLRAARVCAYRAKFCDNVGLWQFIQVKVLFFLCNAGDNIDKISHQAIQNMKKIGKKYMLLIIFKKKGEVDQ